MSDKELDAFARQLGRALQTPEPVSPTFEARVMNAVRAEGPHGQAARLAARPATTWWLRPRTIRMSPVAGLAMAAGFAGLIVTASWAAFRRPPAAAPQAAPPPSVASGVGTGTAASDRARDGTRDGVTPVQFVITAPNAANVTLVGDFNDWDATATPMQRAVAPGVWTVTIPLVPGQHEYAFLVDGSRWLADPTASAAGSDEFGTPSSVVTVRERTT